MPMKMEPVEVYVGESGDICIKQNLGIDEPSCVMLHPSQVQAVAEWMLQCVPEGEAVMRAGGGEAWNDRVAELEAECLRLQEALANAREELAQAKVPHGSTDGDLN